MWIEVHIYSVRTKSQAGNIWVKESKIWWQHKDATADRK